MMRLLILIFLLCPVVVSAQSTTVYTNSTSGAITDNNCGTPAQIVRSFVVAGGGVVGDVDLAVVASHTYRSDLRITLQSPAGTSVTVMAWPGNVQSGDNLNDLFDDEAVSDISAHPASSNDSTTGAAHSYRPSSPLSAYDGQNAAGTWTLTLCDAVSVDTGTFLRADLTIRTVGLAVSKSSAVLSDPSGGANPKAIPGAVVEYCVLVSNAGGVGVIPSTGISATDMLPPNLTYLPGSMRTGTTCIAAGTSEDDDGAGADEADPFGMRISGTNIIGTAATLVPGATFAMVFRATIN